MSVRVVIDTCVWVAAMRSRRGASFRLLSLLPRSDFRFGISVALYLEYQQALLRLAQGHGEQAERVRIRAVLATLAHFGDEVPVFYRLRPNLKDPGDDMVFECAVHYGASHIVTFNTSDCERREVKGYDIETIVPKDFLRLLKERVL